MPSFVDLEDQGGHFKTEVVVWGKKQVTLEMDKIGLLVPVQYAMTGDLTSFGFSW